MQHQAQMVGYPKRSLVEDRQEGPKPVTSTSTRANNSHLDEEKMKATMKENTQLKNEVQELKMKFERYEKYEELLAALAAERSAQD